MNNLDKINVKIWKLFVNKYLAKNINSNKEGIELSNEFKNEAIKLFNKNEYSMIKISLKYNPYINKIINWHCILYKKIKNITIKSYDDYHKNKKLGYEFFKKNNERFIIEDWNQEPTEVVLTKMIILND